MFGIKQGNNGEGMLVAWWRCSSSLQRSESITVLWIPLILVPGDIEGYQVILIRGTGLETVWHALNVVASWSGCFRNVKYLMMLFRIINEGLLHANIPLLTSTSLYKMLRDLCQQWEEKGFTFCVIMRNVQTGFQHAVWLQQACHCLHAKQSWPHSARIYLRHAQLAVIVTCRASSALWVKDSSLH